MWFGLKLLTETLNPNQLGNNFSTVRIKIMIVLVIIAIKRSELNRFKKKKKKNSFVSKH